MVILAGLGTRAGWAHTPAFIARWGGDVLWAVMVYVLCALARPGASPTRLALAAALISLGVEASQLIQTPWLVALRRTTPGALVLGRGFLWSDVVCYLIGASCGGLIDALRVAWRAHQTTPGTAH